MMCGLNFCTKVLNQKSKPMPTFQELISSSQPVLVDFYADWCGPCKAMSPVLQELAGRVDGKARILKVNVDRNPQTTALYAIRGVPTFILFKDGEVKWRESGMMSVDELEKVIREHMSPIEA